MIYVGLIIAAAFHAEALKNIPTEALIGQLSLIVMGQYGALFVGLCVTFACLATASALTEVSTSFLFHHIGREKLPRHLCLILILIMMYWTAILGFSRIMSIATPILTYLYPLLIFLCVINIASKAKQRKYTSRT